MGTPVTAPALSPRYAPRFAAPEIGPENIGDAIAAQAAFGYLDEPVVIRAAKVGLHKFFATDGAPGTSVPPVGLNPNSPYHTGIAGLRLGGLVLAAGGTGNPTETTAGLLLGATCAENLRASGTDSSLANGLIADLPSFIQGSIDGGNIDPTGLFLGAQQGQVLVDGGHRFPTDDVPLDEIRDFAGNVIGVAGDIALAAERRFGYDVQLLSVAAGLTLAAIAAQRAAESGGRG